MKFSRSFKFYAAHRNQHLSEKCASLHGHRYQVDYTVRMHPRSSEQEVTVLFCDFEKVEKDFTSIIDHSTLLDVMDPIKDYIVAAAVADAKADHWRIVFLPCPTSAENLACAILAEFSVMLLKKLPRIAEVLSLTLRETDSTAVTVTLEDLADFKETPFMVTLANEKVTGAKD